jgi:hypothetical protein
MSRMHSPRLTTLAVIGVAATLASACGNADNAPGAPAAAAQSAGAQRKGRGFPDPCALLSAEEAQVYVGALVTPPFRSTDDGAVDATGDACAYRGSGARQIIVVRIGEGAAVGGQVMHDVPYMLSGALEKAGAGDLATATHRVMADVPNGPWDKANWIPGGTLFMTKGDMGANIDVSGSSGKEDDAIAIARVIVPRFDHPLDYDGAKAAVVLPKPKAHPRSACGVVPQSTVERAIGPLNGAPSAQPDGSTCAYHVASAQGPRTYQVEFVWQGGTKNFNELKNSMSTLGSAIGGTIPTGGMDTMNVDPNMSKMIGGLMNLAGAGGGAPGAATQVGFKTDTTLKGPWDSAMLLHGTQLLAVKNDVMVGMDLQSADYEKAKALMAVICSSL